jgi:hypothetical protein
MNSEKHQLYKKKETELEYALIKMKVKRYSIFKTLFFIFLLCSIQIINLPLALIFTFLFALYKAYTFKIFNYIYYFEIENETLKLYLLNVVGEKTEAVFIKSDIKNVNFFDEGKTIHISHIHNDTFKIVSLYALKNINSEIQKMNIKAA